MFKHARAKNSRLIIGGFLKSFSLKVLPIGLGVIIFMPSVASAATLLSESFFTKEQIPTGAIVSLQKGSTTNVESATLGNTSYLLGVVIDSSSSQISISSKQSNQVHVATSGIEQVLVSDINGEIEAGDSITSSPISGVGMKATTNTKVIGVAQDNFPNNTAKEQEYTDKSKSKKKAKIGSVPLLINVANYYKQPDKTIIPQAIQNIANAVAGKKVSPLPIIISAGIFIITMIVVMSIIYSMIRSSIISVGRNPMSQSAVYRNVIQLSALVIVILGVAVGAIYMVLAKF